MPKRGTQQGPQPAAQTNSAVMPNGQVQPQQQEQTMPQQNNWTTTQNPKTDFQPVPQPNPVSVAPAYQTPYTPGQAGTINQQGVYNPLNNVPTYQPYQQQGNQGLATGQAVALAQMLNSGGSMNPDVVAKMQGAARDQSALMQQQNLGALQSQLAGRGLATNQGYGLGQQRQLMNDSTQNLLNQYRGIDIQAAQQNQNDKLNTFSALNQYQNQAANQASQEYQNQLAGYGLGQSNLQAGAASAQAAINSANQNNQFNTQLAQALGIYNSQAANQANQFNASQGQNLTLAQLQAFLQQQQINNQNSQFGAQLNQQGSQFDRTLGFNQDQFGWNKQLSLAQLAQNANQFGANLGFNYANLQNTSDSNLINAILHPNGQ
jgi:hypothetical protein